MEIATVLLETVWLGKPAWIWLSFMAIVVTLLVLDLGVLHREQREIAVRESLLLSAGYIAMGLGYGAFVWHELGRESGVSYLTGFLVEKSLSMDNVFVIAMVFSFFAIPRRYQHRVLFWGILGVIVLRAIMIGLGAALVSEFSWVLYLFGAFLLATGVKMLFWSAAPPDIGGHPLLRWLKSRLHVTEQLHGERFVVRRRDAGGRLRWFATPLLLALVLIEAADLVFAVDSVPAIFAITQDPFIVYTSNIFAILGLRALYFALAAMIERFKYLKYALAVVLIFIGFLTLIATTLPYLVSRELDHFAEQIPAYKKLLDTKLLPLLGKVLKTRAHNVNDYVRLLSDKIGEWARGAAGQISVAVGSALIGVAGFFKYLITVLLVPVVASVSKFSVTGTPTPVRAIWAWAREGTAKAAANAAARSNDLDMELPGTTKVLRKKGGEPTTPAVRIYDALRERRPAAPGSATTVISSRSWYSCFARSSKRRPAPASASDNPSRQVRVSCQRFFIGSFRLNSAARASPSTSHCAISSATRAGFSTMSHTSQSTGFFGRQRKPSARTCVTTPVSITCGASGPLSIAVTRIDLRASCQVQPPGAAPRSTAVSPARNHFVRSASSSSTSHASSIFSAERLGASRGNFRRGMPPRHGAAVAMSASATNACVPDASSRCRRRGEPGSISLFFFNAPTSAASSPRQSVASSPPAVESGASTHASHTRTSIARSQSSTGPSRSFGSSARSSVPRRSAWRANTSSPQAGVGASPVKTT